MKKYTLLLSIIFSFFGAKAQSGFFGTGGGLVIYEANGGGNVNSYNYNQNIGNVQSLFLKGGIIHTWKSGSGNICGGEIYYRVYKEGNPSGTFTPVNLSFSANHTFSTNAIPNNINSGGSGDQRWLNDGLNLNVLSLTNEVGTWVLEVYFRANTCSGEVFYNNFGNNFRILFDVSGFDAFASAINIGNCQSNNQPYNLTGDNVNRFSSTNFGDDLGSFFANSGELLLQGGQIKTYKSNVSNVCLPRLYYRVFPQGSPSGAFNMLEINQTISSCTGCPGTFNNGSPCNGYNSCNDQMWQRFNAGIDVLALANNIPGSYELQVYFEIPGSINSSSSCSYLKYLSNFGSNFSANFTILPQVTASNDGPYCVGQTIQINGSSSTSPSWSGPVSFSNSNQNPTRPTAAEAMSGEYIFSSTLANGCSQSASTFVTVSISAVAGSNSPVCVGSTLNLTSSAGSSYSWTGPNSFASTLQNPTVSASATTAMSGTYSVSIVGACGSTGGVVDNFSDGNFTANPVWTEQPGEFVSSVTKLVGNDSNTEDIISTPSTQAYGVWNFDYRFETTGYTSSGDQFVAFFITSSNAGLKVSNGYYVYVESSGQLRLTRRNGSSATTTIISSSISSPNELNTSWHTIKVIRGFSGLFELYFDGVLKGTGTDNTYTTSTHLGPWIKGRFASDNHEVDNISCSPPATAQTTIVVNSTPTASNAGSSQTICQGTSATLAANNPTSGTGFWSVTSGPNTSASQFVNTGVYNTTFTPTAAGTYVLTWTISNSPCTPSSSNVTITSIATSPCACLSYPSIYAQNTDLNDITNITIGSLNNTSTCGDNPGLNSVPFRYSNYTNSINGPIVVQGQTLNFSLTSNNCGGSSNQNYFLIYIDFNQNGSFAEANEKVYSQIGTSPPFATTQTIIGTIAIPGNSLTGTTRMRIVNTTGSFPGNNYAETNIASNGETEDYCVTIIPCAQPTINTQPTDFTQCFNGNQTLTVSASGTSLTYQWYSNTTASITGGTSLGSANGAQTATYTPPSAVAGAVYYYCVVTESNACSSTSNVVTVTVLPQLNAGTVQPIPTSGGGPSNLVIYQVYSAGGNIGATYTNDFVVLYNPTGSSVNLNGWSLQYASASGTTWTNNFNLSGTIQSGGYFLVQLAAGTNIFASLPTPDAIGTIAMAAAGGKVALVNSTTALTGSCPTGVSIVDFVGFGTANCSEGSSAAPAPSTTTWDTRINNGCQDTQVNSADFTAGTATIRNSASPTNFCTISSNTETICAGQNASNITATDASGANGTFTYQWYSQAGNVACPTGSSTVGWTSIAGATNNASFNPNPVSATTTYALYVTATGTNNCGGAWSTDCRKVVVNPAPIITDVITSVCSGSAFTGTPLNVTNGTVPSGTTYTWTVAANTNVTGQSAQASAQSSISQTLTNSTNTVQTVVYTVTPTTGSCVGTPFSLTVTVNPRPLLSNANISACTGVPFSYTPTGSNIPTGTTYSWSAPSGSNFTSGVAGSGASIVDGALTLSSGSSATAVYTIMPSSGSCTGSTFNLTVNLSDCAPVTPFTPCNLVVYRVGDGSTSLTTNTALAVSVQEMTTTGTVVQTISGLFTGANLLTQSANATSVGMLNSYNGFLAVPGLNSSVGTSNAASENTKVTHIINGQANLSNRIVHPTSLPMPFNSDTYRSVIPVSTNTFYSSGDGSGTTKGVYYYNGITFSQVIDFTTRNIEIFNGQLYYSTASNTSGNIGIYSLGSGLPSSTASATPVITYPATNGNGPYGFSISPDGCTAYIADDGSTNYVGISKWTKNSSGNWVFQYKNTTPARGMIVDYSGLDPIIYVSTTESQNNKILKITDNGSLATAITISTSGFNYRFAGIDFTPNSTTTTSNPISTQPVTTSSLCNSQTQTLLVMATGSNTYQWYSNTVNSICGATPITGATSATYIPPVATSSGTTYYFVKVATNCYNIFYSNIAAVTTTINSAPTVNNNGPICSGNSITVTATPNPNQSGTYSYSWTVPSGVLDLGNVASFTTLVSGTYTVVTSLNGCNSPSSSTAVTINQPPSLISISPP